MRSHGLGRDVVAVLGTMLLLGVLCGVAWSLLADPAAFTKTASGGEMSELQLGQRFQPDGVYALLAGGVGLVAGLALMAWRRRDPLLTGVLLLVGSAGAAALSALVGHVLGPGSTKAGLAAARTGALVPEPLRVDALPVYLVWPLAVLLGAFVVLIAGPGERPQHELSTGSPREHTPVDG